MARKLPNLSIGETYFLDNSDYIWRNIPVPNCVIIGKKWLGRVVIGVDTNAIENIDFVEFLWYTYETNIPIDFTQDFLRNELGITIDIYKLLDNNRERMDDVRIIRKRKLMDDIEQSKHFDNILKTPDEIAYAKAVNQAKLMIVSRTQKEYNLQQEQKIDMTSNIAQIFIPEKE